MPLVSWELSLRRSFHFYFGFFSAQILGSFEPPKTVLVSGAHKCVLKKHPLAYRLETSSKLPRSKPGAYEVEHGQRGSHDSPPATPFQRGSDRGVLGGAGR